MKYLIIAIIVLIVFLTLRSGKYQSDILKEYQMLPPEEQQRRKEALRNELADYFSAKGDSKTINDLFDDRYDYRQMMVLKRKYRV